MDIVEDLKNELYTLSDGLWSANLTSLLKLLSFPAELKYTCNREQFLFEYSGKTSVLSLEDRDTLKDCIEIAEYKMSHGLEKIRLFGVQISGNQRMHNEKAFYIYRLFARLYGRYTMIAFVDDDKLAFAGMSIDNRKHIEAVISEWFSYCDGYEKLNRLSEVDFSLLAGKNYREIYNEYVWAIAREYVRKPESRLFLIYNCDKVVTYDKTVKIPGTKKWETIIKIDKGETLEVNSAYYPELFGWDYFVDDREAKYDDSFLIGSEYENDSEVEWALLEMELAAEEMEKEKEKNTEEENDLEQNENENPDADNMNPEEMLDYIRKFR